MSALITLDQVSYAIDDQHIIRDISLDIHAGQIISLIGYNGSGKSTLLKLMLWSIKPTVGTITTTDGIMMGYMPQSTTMRRPIPLTVRDFLMIYGISGMSLTQTIQTHHLWDVLYRPLHALSWGQLQRVLLAQAVAHDPDLILMDEPTAWLDINAQEEFYDGLEGIMDRPWRSLVIVSHDIHTVYAQSDLVVCLHQGICCVGRPDDQHLSDDIRRLFGEHVLPYRHHHHE